MKKKIAKLDVDYIGGQKQPLTREEEEAISKHLKASSEHHKKALSKRSDHLMQKCKALKR